MDTDALARELAGALAAIPLLDAHTHLDATHLAARGLHDVLLYHMVVSDLVSAGCPDREFCEESRFQGTKSARLATRRLLHERAWQRDTEQAGGGQASPARWVEA